MFIFSFLFLVTTASTTHVVKSAPSVTVPSVSLPHRGPYKIGICVNVYDAVVDTFEVSLCWDYNYSKPLFKSLFKSSEFELTGLPEGIYDLIIRKPGYFSRKISCINLDSLTPVYVDTLELYNAQAKVAGINLCFKSSASVQEKKQLISRSGIVFKSAAVMMDTLLYAPNVERSAYDALEIFISSPLTHYAEPVFPLH